MLSSSDIRILNKTVVTTGVLEFSYSDFTLVSTSASRTMFKNSSLT